MGFRMRKSVKIAPGIKLNFSKSGVSTTFGGKGHHVNVSKRGVRSTTSIPGTGISYTSSSGHHKSRRRKKQSGCLGCACMSLIIGCTIALAVMMIAMLI